MNFLTNSKLLLKHFFFHGYVSKDLFVSKTYLCLQIEIVFIKREQNHRWPHATCRKNDYINILILWIWNRIQNLWHRETQKQMKHRDKKLISQNKR